MEREGGLTQPLRRNTHTHTTTTTRNSWFQWRDGFSSWKDGMAQVGGFVLECALVCLLSFGLCKREQTLERQMENNYLWLLVVCRMQLLITWPSASDFDCFQHWKSWLIHGAFWRNVACAFVKTSKKGQNHEMKYLCWVTHQSFRSCPMHGS